MNHKLIIFVVLPAVVSMAWLGSYFVSEKPVAENPAEGGAGLSDSKASVGEVRGIEADLDIDQKVPCSGQHSCSGCDKHGRSKVSEQLMEVNRNTWPVAVLDFLKNKHPQRAAGIVHMSRAISYAEFEQLPEAQAKRLVKYAQYTQDESARGTVTSLPFLCWARDTAEPVRVAFDKVRFLAVQEGENENPQAVMQGDDRWTRTATDGNTGSSGTPVTITWSFVPDGTTIPNGDGGTGTSNLIARLNATYGSATTNDLRDAPWFELFESSFNYWAEVTGNTYVYEASDDGKQMLSSNSNGELGVRGDVRIGGLDIDGDSGILAFNYFPNTGDMVIDTNDSSNLTNDSTTKRRFRNVIAHEHGHGLGLSHVCPVNQTKLMEPFVTTSFSGVQFDDMITSQGLYGDLLERSGGNKNNETRATSYDLGELTSSYQASDVSISRTGDVDVYKFRVPSGKQLTVNVTPTTQSSYLEGAQSGGSCTAGTSFDPSNRQNLAVRVLAADGSELANSNSSGIGAGESISNVLLSRVGEDYFVEVTGGGENAGDDNNAQVYALGLTLVDARTLGGSDFQIVQEGCAPANLAADPGETVTVQLTVTNTGVSTISSPQVTLSGSADLTVNGASTQSLSSLGVGQSANVQFEIVLAGSCGDRETLTFALDTGDGSSTYQQELTLGVEGIAFEADFEGGDVFPSAPNEITEESDSDTARWRVTMSSPVEGSRSAYSAGTTDVNSSFLTTGLFTPAGGSPELSFKHSYDLERRYDGGVLEIQIDGGSWKEWTSAGGRFTENGYDHVINSGFGSHIAGDQAWSGNSGGVLITRAVFPSSAIGKSVRLRWRNASDSAFSEDGWWIDTISITGMECCEGNLPVVSISVSDGVAREQDVSDKAELVITSNVAPAANLQVAYTVSGTATSGDDFQVLSGVAMIPAGQQMVVIPVVAVADALIEGSETVTLTLSTSASYAVDSNKSASVKIEDLPFDSWRYQNFGVAQTNVGDLEDFDFDGMANLLEYALGLNPTIPDSRLESAVLVEGAQRRLTLAFTEDTELTDISYVVETSTNLEAASWTETGVSKQLGLIVDGKRTVTAAVDADGVRRFLRLRVVRK